MSEEAKILLCGDSAVTVQFGETAEISINQKVRAFEQLLLKNKPYGILETIPTYRSLMVYYDPLTLQIADLRQYLLELTGSLPDEEVQAENEGIRVPVWYQPPGSEIEMVAEYENKSVEEIVRIHTQHEHYVFMLGFTPGNAYIGCPQKTFSIPRKSTPTARPYAGSVAVWSNQTGIGGALTSPTGWYSLGRSPLLPYDPRRSEPILFKSGQWIQFYAIDADQYTQIEHEVREMRYVPELYQHK